MRRVLGSPLNKNLLFDLIEKSACHEDSQAIFRYIKIDIRKRIFLDHFRLSQSDFASAWESTLCNVANSSFHVLL